MSGKTRGAPATEEVVGAVAAPDTGADFEPVPGCTANEPQEVRSPCIRVCSLDDERVCGGCGRTLDEIGRWARMSAHEKRSVNARVGFDGG